MNSIKAPRRQPSLPIIRPLPATPLTASSYKFAQPRYLDTIAGSPIVAPPLQTRRSSFSESKTTTEVRVGGGRRGTRQSRRVERLAVESMERKWTRGERAEEGESQSRSKAGKSNLIVSSPAFMVVKLTFTFLSRHRESTLARRSVRAVVYCLVEGVHRLVFLL